MDDAILSVEKEVRITVRWVLMFFRDRPHGPLWDSEKTSDM